MDNLSKDRIVHVLVALFQPKLLGNCLRLLALHTDASSLTYS